MGGPVKRRLLDLHLYVGLLCAPYVVIYGLSAIAFNHEITGGGRESDRQVPLHVTLPAKDPAAAEAVRQALGLVGWIPTPRIQRRGPERIVMLVGRPGSELRVDADAGAGVARIHERRFGVVGVLRGLHGLKELAGTRWGRSWGIYTELSAWGILFSVLSGTWLCLPRRGARLLAGGLLALGSVAAVALAAAVW